MSTIVSQEPLLPPMPPRGDEPLYEIIDGQKVELPPMSPYASRVIYRLVGKMIAFAESHDLGEAVGETLFHLPLPVDRNRRPDGAFVSFQRWPKSRPMRLTDNAWDVVPDLAIEVVSPSDFPGDLMTKIDEYFRAGVRLVWAVYPATRLLHIFDSLTSVRVLTISDELDGGQVLPGFRLPVTILFPDEVPSS